MDEDPSAESYRFCKAFRKLAKQARALACQGDLEDQTDRETLLENLWDLGSELHVWAGGIAQAINVAIFYVYTAADDQAVHVLDHLAEEELRNLKRASAGAEEQEEGDAGSG